MDKIVDRCLAGFLLLFALGNLIGLPFQEWAQRGGPKVLAPEFFPELLLSALAIAALVLCVLTFALRPYDTDYEAPRWSGLLLGLALVLFALAVPTFGFVPSAIVLCLAVMLAMGERRLILLASVAILAPVSVTWIAGRVLHVVFP